MTGDPLEVRGSGGAAELCTRAHAQRLLLSALLASRPCSPLCELWSEGRRPCAPGGLSLKPAQAQAADVSDLTTSLRLPCPPRWVATLRPLLCGRLGFLGGGWGSHQQQDPAFSCVTPHAVSRLPAAVVHLCSRVPPLPACRRSRDTSPGQVAATFPRRALCGGAEGGAHSAQSATPPFGHADSTAERVKRCGFHS